MTFLGVLSDPFRGENVTSIWVINPGHDWKKLVDSFRKTWIFLEKKEVEKKLLLPEVTSDFGRLGPEKCKGDI